MVSSLNSVFTIHGGRSILVCRTEIGGWILKYLLLGQIRSLESFGQLSSPTHPRGPCFLHP